MRIYAAWRPGALLAFGAAGCAVAFGYRGEWAAAAAVGACALLPVFGWVRGELAAARAMLREIPPTMPSPGPPPRPRPRQPWDTAPMPALTWLSMLPAPDQGGPSVTAKEDDRDGQRS